MIAASPVGALAVAAYVALLGALLHVGPSAPAARRAGAWSVLLTLAVVLGGGALWFTGVQVFIIKKLCIWCAVAHTLGIILSAALLILAPVGGGMLIRLGRAGVMIALGLVLLGALVAGQSLQRLPLHETRMTGDFDTGPGPDRQIGFTVNQGQFVFNPHQHPTLGSPDAKRIIFYLFDYACPHCRELHEQLDLVRQRYGDEQLGIVALPAPYNPNCNPAIEFLERNFVDSCDLAKVGLAVWHADRSQYEAFDRWIYAQPLPLSLAAARDKARSLVGAEAFDQAEASDAVAEHVTRGVTLFQHIGAAGLPQLFYGAVTLPGRPESPQVLFEVLERELGIAPRP